MHGLVGTGRRGGTMAAALALGAMAAAPAVADMTPADHAAAVLDAHCARCHQTGRTEERAPERFGHILNLEELARDRRLVAPGQPDASLLYQRMLGRHGPLDVFAAESGPTPQEIERIRDWIAGLAPLNDARNPAGPVAAVAPETVSTIALGLWPDTPKPKVGDLATFSVSASVPCHLTLISVDQDGQAIVLFPNDIEPDNLIAAGAVTRIPGREAGYQLRYDRAGPETVVAICLRTRRMPEGVGVDYQKQRFTILGDWRTFLRTSAEREAEARRRAQRRNRSKSNGELPPIDATGRNIEGRTAITIPVADAPAPHAGAAP